MTGEPPAPVSSGVERNRQRANDALHLEFPAEPYSIRSALARVGDWLDTRGTDRDMRGTVEIVLAEALNNIAEHAYADRPAGPVEIRIEAVGRGLGIEVQDCGKPIPGGSLPLGRGLTGPEPRTLPEGGFGWLLIRRLSSDLSVSRHDGRNRLRFRLTLEEPAGIACSAWPRQSSA